MVQIQNTATSTMSKELWPQVSRLLLLGYKVIQPISNSLIINVVLLYDQAALPSGIFSKELKTLPAQKPAFEHSAQLHLKLTIISSNPKISSELLHK